MIAYKADSGWAFAAVARPDWKPPAGDPGGLESPGRRINAMAVNKQTKSGRFPQTFLDVGWLVLLGGILVAASLLFAMVGMRIAVRRTEVSVPAVVGMTTEQAKAVMERAELRLEVIGQRYDETAEKGRIIAQFPAAAGRLKAKRPVQVHLSLGPRTHPVPNLLGSTLRVAQLKAGQYNYEVGHVSQITREGSEKETVIAQFPPPDSADAVSPKINILISKGVPASYVMPDVTGQNLNEVQPYLEARGFKLPSVDYRFYRNATKGTVVKQFPEPGYLLAQGDTINLEVAH